MSGLWSGVAAYVIWGLVPIYWRLFRHVPAIQVLGHRIVWSLVLLAILVASARRRGRAPHSVISLHVVGLYAVAAVLIGINGFLYVFAVNAGFIVETSLGYFIAPLVNVLLGVVVFRERLRPLQWLAVALAAAGVLHLALAYGTLPWIATGLALSFGSYGLVKKKAPLPPVQGLTLETAIQFAPAIVYLLILQRNGEGAFLRTGALADVLMIGSGVVTVGPLLLFASAVQRVPLSVIGILQYIAPTIQFLLGVFVFHEPFSRTQLVGFAIVWTALAVFTIDGIRARRRPAPLAVLDEGTA
jgi:chloramphenicol-sensitive protein RarD